MAAGASPCLQLLKFFVGDSFNPCHKVKLCFAIDVSLVREIMLKKTKNGLEIQSSWYKETFLISLVLTVMLAIGSSLVFIFQNDEPYTIIWMICLLVACIFSFIFFWLRFIKSVIVINEQGICRKFIFKKERFIAWENVEEYGCSFYKGYIGKYHSSAVVYALYFSDKKIGMRKGGWKNAKVEAVICLLVEKKDIVNGFLHKDGQCESMRKYCKRYTAVEPYLDKYNWN